MLRGKNMRDSSWAVFCLRFASSIFVVSFLCLLYWSSLLQEERLRSIDERLEVLEERVSALKNCNEFNGNGTSANEREASAENTALLPHRQSKHIDAKYPNLLADDTYYFKTLPTLLPQGFTPSGILRQASIGKANDLHPFSQWAHVSEWTSYCWPSAGDLQFGKYSALAKDLAIKIEERDTERQDLTAFWVHLRDGVFWQPLEKAHFSGEIDLAAHFLKKHKVTAEDFKFYFDAIKNPGVDVAQAVSLRLLFRDIESIEVIDDLTFVVYYKRAPIVGREGGTIYKLPYIALRNVISLKPLPSFVFKYRSDGKKIFADDGAKDYYQTSSLWAQQFVNHFAKRVIVSCGAWIFDGASDRQIRFRRNPDFYIPNYALFGAIEVYFLENFDAIWRDFMAQRIDSCELSSQNLVELDRFMDSSFYKREKEKGHEIKRIEYPYRAFAYIGWNQKKPFFTNKKVRQALSFAIDTKRLIQQNLNGQGIQISGPFFCFSSAYDSSLPPYPYDPDQARRMLAEAGWIDSDGDGIIDKEIDGKRVPFRFSLTYYVKNPVSRANVELISTLLRQIGIDCVLHGVDVADLSATIDDKSFDAYYLAWQLTPPPEDAEQVWHSQGATVKGSSNTIGFANPEADKIIELLKYEADPEVREKLYHRFDALIYDEAPYAFLYTPKTTLVYWSWLKNVFVPKDHQDIIPGADVEQPSVIHGWKIGGRND